jgi:hypothetical protein
MMPLVATTPAHARTNGGQVGTGHDDHMHDLERVALLEQQHQPLRGRAELQQHRREDDGRRGVAEKPQRAQENARDVVHPVPFFSAE